MSLPTFLDPPTIAPPVGSYSHCARITAETEFIFLSGQVGLRPDGSLPQTIEEQAIETFKNIVRALEANGMTLANLAKINTFMVQGHAVEGMRAARAAVLGDARPASTTVFVPQLVDPRHLIEVEAVFAR